MSEKYKAQEKWTAKAGLVTKTFKIDKATAEAFQETCQRLGISMGPQITKMMQDFIEANKPPKEG